MGDALLFEDVTGAGELLASLERSGLARSDAAVDLGQALAVLLRSAHLLALDALGSCRRGLPAVVQGLMERPDPEPSPDRDALADPGDTLGLEGVIDFLSAEELSCVAPELHRGWQDRRQSCVEARRLGAEAAGFSLDAGERGEVLEALALCKRLFVLPPPVRLDPERLRAALSAVVGLIERLRPGAAARILG